MLFKFQRICPICGKEELTNISRPSSYVHGLKALYRKPWLKLVKYQTMNIVYKHLSTAIREQAKYPFSVKKSRMTMMNVKKQKIAVKPRVINEFLYYKILYPNFKS